MSDEKNDVYYEIKSIILSDKREIHLNDENDVSVSIELNGETLFCFPVAYPSGGYGGGFLQISPSESFLLFSYYSGQSQEAFILFRIIDSKLEMVFDLPYLCGEGACYCFSNEEKLLIQGLPHSYTLFDWEDTIEEGFSEIDENGDLYFSFGYINVLEIEKGVLSEHLIRVYPSEGARSSAEVINDDLMLLEMTNTDVLKISLPWSDEIFSFPLNNTIRIDLV